MTSATIVVIDGLGIGAMPDAGTLRPGDVRADTLGSIAGWRRERGGELRIPSLAALGLAELRPDLRLEAGERMRGHGARVALGYPGADTFAGHQTMMGADMSHVVLARVGEHVAALTDALRSAGHDIELLDEQPLLVVDGEALVHDNLEADPGLNWNVSARLDRMPWQTILDIATHVRRVAPVARVIAVGGTADGPLPEFVRQGAQQTIGLDTPASGFYRNGGLQVQHLGADIDHARQLPEAAARAGIPVTLVGKAADILATDATLPEETQLPEVGGVSRASKGADATTRLPEVPPSRLASLAPQGAGAVRAPVRRLPGVDTAEVLAATLAAAGDGLVVANVQQTDLAGHSQDVARWAELLEQTDAAIGGLVQRLGPDDLLVVTGDHGNDPTIGHNFHTREHVPALAATGSAEPWQATTFDSLADVGATVAAWLGLEPGVLANGEATTIDR